MSDRLDRQLDQQMKIKIGYHLSIACSSDGITVILDNFRSELNPKEAATRTTRWLCNYELFRRSWDILIHLKWLNLKRGDKTGFLHKNKLIIYPRAGKNKI